MNKTLTPAPEPLTEDLIERVVEKRMDTLDKEFMSGAMHEDAYIVNAAAIDAWATREYTRTRHAISWV